MKAIETRYAGCRFRSRLEARWAVFFDALGMRWEYEPEGFELPSGARYLPDFWLPDNRKWVEVKGNHAGAGESLQRALEFAGHWLDPQHEEDGPKTPLRPLRVLGNIPKRVADAGTLECLGPIGRQLPDWLPAGQEVHYVALDDGTIIEGPPGHVVLWWIPVYWLLAGRDAVIDAANRARSARFEHGERG